MWRYKKKLPIIEAEDDCTWITTDSGTHVCLKDGQDHVFAMGDDIQPKISGVITAMRKDTNQELMKEDPKGSIFLTQDGELLGTANSFDTHDKLLGRALDKSNTQLILSPGKDVDKVDSFVKSSGVVRVFSNQYALGLTTGHPLTSSQKNSLQDLIISKGYSRNEVNIELIGKMEGVDTFNIISSLFTESKK